jgi:hypothetical protein
MSDLVFLTVLMALAHGLGFVAIRWTVGLLMGRRIAEVGYAQWLPIVAPLGAAVLAELITGKWDGTPGGAGTGGLTVVVPMLVSGAVAGVVAVVLRACGPKAPEHALYAFMVATFVLVIVTLALYGLWPAPRARLF